MKRIMVMIFFILLAYPAVYAEVLSVDPSATPRPIRITVEGEEDAKLTATASAATITATTQPGISILKAIAVRHPAAGIKKMMEKNSMESEVMDAIIAKLADMEEDQKRQQVFNACMLAGMAVLAALIIFILIIRKKKKS
jgi:hypothetical protein